MGRQKCSTRYSVKEWEDVKPVLRRLYMETGATLEQVGCFMAEQHNFHPPLRMYKHRFAGWGWRKNNRRTYPAGEGTVSQCAPRGQQRYQYPQAFSQIRHVISPDVFYVQELVVASSRDFCDASLSGWSVGPLTIWHHRYTEERVHSFLDAQTQFQFAIHQLKRHRVDAAYRLLGRLFDFTSGSEIYLHPKFVLSWALAVSVYFDLCGYVKDANYALVRAVMRFGGANASAVFGTKSPNHPALRLMHTIAAQSNASPEYIRKVLCSTALASADSLQQTLGPLHPTVLFAHSSVLWHWGCGDSSLDVSSRSRCHLHYLVASRLAADYPTALASADKELGRLSDVSIGVCYDFTHLLFCIQEEYSPNSTGSSQWLPFNLREIADDLFDRTQGFTTGPCSEVLTETQRAYAFACMVQGVFALQGGQPGTCRRIFDDAISWLRQGDANPKMLAEMMDADFEMLMEAFTLKQTLKLHDLNFAHPRWFDGEKEVPIKPQTSDDVTSRLDLGSLLIE